jgi:hypothetical protein
MIAPIIRTMRQKSRLKIQWTSTRLTAWRKKSKDSHLFSHLINNVIRTRSSLGFVITSCNCLILFRIPRAETSIIRFILWARDKQNSPTPFCLHTSASTQMLSWLHHSRYKVRNTNRKMLLILLNDVSEISVSMKHDQIILPTFLCPGPFYKTRVPYDVWCLSPAKSPSKRTVPCRQSVYLQLFFIQGGRTLQQQSKDSPWRENLIWNGITFFWMYQ